MTGYLESLAAVCLAQADGGAAGGGGYGWWWGWWWVWVVGFIVLLMIIWLVALAFRGYNNDVPPTDTTTGSPPKDTPTDQPPKTPLDILEERYARGAITRAEYERMKQDLKR
jgi:putative membrane protein